ncbi:MAG: TonB-dependent receptor, partial [Mucilaginibacter sp.]|nr:TonB-dependent receptor [Mucilaginibacter sp.]
MKFLYTIIAIAFLIPLKSNAQTSRTVKGIVKDSTGYLIAGTSIKMLTGTDSTTVVTGADGGFTFNNIKVNQFSLVFSSIGYQPLRRRFVLANDNKPANLPPVIMKIETTMLNTVVIADVNPVKLKEDTIEFNADAYKVRDNAPVEDVIKKLPGMDVDKDGNITAQGKSVTKVRV